MSKARLDLVLVERGLVSSRHEAQVLIRLGRVYSKSGRLDKPGLLVDPGAEIRIKEEARFLSRGGYKLEGALEAFGLNPEGWICLDVGASTGGFTHCLLLRGAAHVYALDVGENLLHEKLRKDPRVTVLDGVNARYFRPELLPGPVDFITVDVSFIGLSLVLPPLIPALRSGGLLLPMVKPQFEAGKGRVGKGGVVRDPGVREETVEKIRRLGGDLGLQILGTAASPVKGPKGNEEVFILFRKF
jgi:23S rRNA (cytidine1920-2'-O)/16S rRNA (cytidine1409-2'-O)-methyltransferase